ncbi:MAG: hypothetical protein PHW46_02920 [Candidatus Omnitrophica bacterium]|nr:hypothetical protein [Candidatus Omnitrophota bacterium]
MRGFIYHSRPRRLLAIAFILALFVIANFFQTNWLKDFAEKKVTDFLGNNLSAEIGSVSGGFLSDIVLRDVVFCSGERKNHAFSISKVIISYRITDALKEMFFKKDKQASSLNFIDIYFSDKNPFVKGFLRIFREENKICFSGKIAPVLFADAKKKEIKGSFVKKEDAKYDCDILWDNSLKAVGVLDIKKRSLDMDFSPVEATGKGIAKLRAVIDENGGVNLYSRLDKVDIRGIELIGDISFNLRNEYKPLFSLKMENMVVNKMPFWNVLADGGYSAESKTLFLNSVRWGENFLLFGKIGVEAPYNVDMKLIFNGADLRAIADMLGDTKSSLAGKTTGELTAIGSVEEPLLNGRVRISDGEINYIKFRSLVASLKIKWPVLEITDSRVIQEGGQIIIDGEIQLDKIKQGTSLDKLLVQTDNKVAVWDQWQIAKQDDVNVVEAKKDKVTLRTSLEKNDPNEALSEADRGSKKDMGLEYQIDSANSFKLDYDERGDFVGVKHKVQF